MTPSPVFDHTLYLLPHRQKDENQPIHHQHGPKDWQVEDLTPTAQKGNRGCTCGRMPELELG